jgi:fibronectin-binding autotransporter adhesin
LLGSATLTLTSDSANSTTRELVLDGEGGNALRSFGTGALVWSGNVVNNVTNNGASFALSGTGTGGNEFAGVISNAAVGSLRLLKTESGTWKLTGANTYTATTDVFDGTLQATTIGNTGEASSLGVNSVIRFGGFSTAGVLEYVGTGSTNNRQFKLGGGGTTDNGGTILNNGSGALAFTNATFNTVGDGTFANTTRALTLGGSNADDNTISGTIQDNNSGANTNNVVSVVKIDAGKWVLGGSNTYTGGTVISNGILRLDDANAAGTGAITQSSGSSTLEINTAGTVSNAMSIYNVSTLQTVTLSGNKTLNNATYTVATNTTTTETGVLSGSGGIVKEGAGTLVLAGGADNTYTGATEVNAGALVLSNSSGNAINDSASITVNAGASLVLGASNQIGDGIGLILAGGTFVVGNDSAGFSETLGTLTLSASSTIDLGSYATGLRQLVFSNSSAITWSGTLTITNWQGVAQQSSDVAEILFGTGGLTSTQLGQIYFANQNISGGVLIGGSGELAPIPEAPVIWGAIAVTLVIGWRERFRLAGLLRQARRR